MKYEKKNQVKSRGSALLMTLIYFTMLSVVFTLMLQAPAQEVKLQRRRLMSEKNYGYLEQKMNELCCHMEMIAGEIIEENLEEFREELEELQEELEEPTASVGDSDEELRAEEDAFAVLGARFKKKTIQALKRYLKTEDLEEVISVSVKIGTVREMRDGALLVGDICLSGSAPGNRIHSSVSADLWIRIPEPEACEEDGFDEVNTKGDVSFAGSRASASSADKAADAASVSERTFYDAVSSGGIMRRNGKSGEIRNNLVWLENRKRIKRLIR